MFKITSIGSDPEIILLDKKTHLPKAAPDIFINTETVCVYPDNVLLEFNHKPFTLDNFASGMQGVVREVKDIVDTLDCTFIVGQCEATYSSQELGSKRAHEIGCEPYSNAYKTDKDVVPSLYQCSTRFAGGHLHIGYDTSTINTIKLVKLLDRFLLPLDPNRRSKRSLGYGARGSYRAKSYGLEYRALSNWWLDNPQELVDALKKLVIHVNRG